METLLENGYLPVLEAQSRDALEAALVRFIQELGFQTMSAMVVIDRPLGEPEFIVMDNTPAAYKDSFHDLSKARRDPVMQHCRVKSVPIIWSQKTYLAAGQSEKWEHQAQFGYRHGIALALHLPLGRHFTIGVDRDQPLPADLEETTRMAAALHLLAACAQEPALRLLAPAPGKPGAPELSPRELETLCWTLDGKTAWEIGRILGLSEHTVARHLHNASRKLDCTGKHQAALRALRLGLMD